MKKEFEKIKSFFYKYKNSVIIIYVVTFLLYGFKLFNYSISIDTEYIINNYDSQIMAWNSIGRFSLGILKNIFLMNPFNYYLSNLFVVILFPLAIIMLAYIINSQIKTSKLNNFKLMLFSLIIITSPILLEQFNFTLQCSEVVLSFLIFDLGIYFTMKYLENNKKYLLVIAIICFIENIGCYQSFLTLIISVLVAILLLKNFDSNDKKYNKKYIIISILIIFFSLIGYFIVGKIVNLVYKIETTSYLKNQILWLNGISVDSVINLFKHICAVFVGYGIYYNLLYFMGIIVLLVNIVRNRKKKFNILLLILLCISPFLLSIFLGSMEVVRAQFSIPITFSIILIFMSDFGLKKINVIYYLFIFINVLLQFRVSNYLLVSDYNRYNDDKRFAIQIVNSLNEKFTSDSTIIFVGKKDNKSSLIGETMGHSFFEWDNESVYGVNMRANGFMKTLGYEYNMPTIEQYNIAKEESKNMGIWPSADSVLEKEGFIIIRLS